MMNDNSPNPVWVVMDCENPAAPNAARPKNNPPCTPIGSAQATRTKEAGRELVTPLRPTTAQREVPGLY